ncbi:MAG: hypothetical protein JEZ02_01235 [Desulfatibacillum sp.]|nr:hypothetical protein [Desulfatibacillum sp.]
MLETQSLNIPEDGRTGVEEDPRDFADLPLDSFPRLINLRGNLRRATKRIFVERASLITEFHRKK